MLFFESTWNIFSLQQAPASAILATRGKDFAMRRPNSSTERPVFHWSEWGITSLHKPWLTNATQQERYVYAYLMVTWLFVLTVIGPSVITVSENTSFLSEVTYKFVQE